MSHDHDHAHNASRKRLAVAFGLTLIVFFAQFLGSILTGSIALMVDTAHMLTDVLGLLMALTAATAMMRPATDKHTWGFKRAEVLSAVFQATLLLVVGVYALIESARRIVTPAEIPGRMLLIFASIGLVANLISMFVLMGDKNQNLNMRAAVLEVTTDAIGSVAVIIGALGMIFFDFDRGDSIAAIFIAVLIIPRAIRLARQAFGILLEMTPPNVDLDEVRAHLKEVTHVIDVRDLHLTRISSDFPVLTAHVVVEQECFSDGHVPEILSSLQECVREHLPISVEHSTFQLEPEGHDTNSAC